MSRHRHVRNMRFEDYDDGYDDYYDDDYFSEEEPVSEEAAQYLLHSEPTDTKLTNANGHHQQSQEDGYPAIEFLCEEFSRVLSAALSTEDVEKALADTDYNQDAALATLRARHMPTTTQSNNPLNLDTPSPIGQAVTQSSEFPEPNLFPPTSGTTQSNDVVVTGGRALYPSAGDVTRFDFQNPSPDDVILAKRGRGRERVAGAKLRLPKPSTRAPRPVVPPAQEPEKTTANLSLPKPSTRASRPVVTPALESESTKQPSITNSAVPKRETQKSTKSKGKKIRVPRKVEPRVPKSVQRANGEGTESQTLTSTTATKSQTVQRVKKIDVSSAAEAASIKKLSLSVVVAGHVDAGKSTLLGHLLKLLETSNRSSKRKGKTRDDHGKDLAWTTDQDETERQRGVTIDFCMREFETVRDNKTISFAMLDAPGHRDFVPAMISGATQASAALLVVDASIGEFESGISKDGQTREHAVLLKAVGITSLLVVVNKLDTVEYKQKRYQEVVSGMQSFLKKNGWKVGVKYVPASGRAGVNIMGDLPTDGPLAKWYKGPSVLRALENLALAMEAVDKKRITEEPQKPTRLLVSDSFRSVSLGGVIAVTGRLLRGTIAPRDSLIVAPSGLTATVRHVEINNERVQLAIAGVHNTPINVSLTSVPDTLSISAGHVLCDPVLQVPAATKFRAQIVTRNTDIPLLQGSPVEVHIGGGSEAGTLSKLIELCGRGEQSKRRPRRLVNGDSAIVEVKVERAVCVERSKDLKHLGFFTLRANGKSVAMGIVLDILKTKKGPEEDKSSSAQPQAAS